jgi:4'-phosphopantetheinyl transferase
VIAHGLLRALLARYVDADPAALRFERGLYGKPRLDAAMPANGLRFNMSHTHDMIVFAFARERDVGVDVERWTPDIECLELAKQFFSPAESAALAALPRDAQRAAFFDCWSRKESYIKATGLGVSHGLDHFDVTLAPDQDAALVADRSAPDATCRWQMRDLGLPGGHSGALVAEGMEWHLDRFVASPALIAS